MRGMITFIIGLVVLTSTVFGQTKQVQHPNPRSLECKTCHSCEIPTKSNPCLYPCPREHMITIHHAPEEGPDVITINEFVADQDLYEPVVFTHKLHAEMSGMAGGCTMCHHYNPPGGVLGCATCHEPSRKREDISKPDLKGAYHRQCMDCHRDWSHSIACESCHALKGQGEQSVDEAAAKTTKRVHPKIIEPTKVVYDTDTDQGKLVTFFHNEHVNIFGLECENCHSNESCTRCHDTQEKKPVKDMTLDQHHVLCSKCHDTNNNCSTCHSNKERAPFDHAARTGFDVNQFHSKVSCNRCHTTKGKFTGLKAECSICHGEFTQENFDHKLTGLILSETHAEFECSDCHAQPDYSKPSCENCHDEYIKVPDYYPGEKID